MKCILFCETNKDVARIMVMKINSGSLFVILAAIAWGLLGIFVRALNKVGFESIQIVAIRSVGATIILVIYLLIKDRSALKIKIKDIWVFLGTGIGSMVFFNYCYFGSIKRTSLAIAAALLYTAPAFVAILARIFLGERISKMGLLSIVLAIVGCMLTSGIIGSFSQVDTIGLLLGLGSGLGYALYSIFGKKAIDRGYKSITITFYTFLITMLCTLPFLIKKMISAHYSISSIEAETGMMKFVASIVGLIVISTIAAYILYTKGIERISASTASVLASVEPVVATLISIIILKENVSVAVLVGICLILTSTIVSCVRK